MQPDGEKLYRLAQVAERANLSIRAVETHVQKGALKVVRVGPHRRPRVREGELKKYLGMPDDDTND